MDELTLKVFIVGSLANNCYLIYSRKSKNACLIDCTAPTSRVRAFIKSHELKLSFIWLTHAHFDHITGLNDFTAPFYLHKDDAPFLADADLNGSAFFNEEVASSRKPLLYHEAGALSFEARPLTVIHTPGHTPGSVCLLLDNWLFSGDTLFYRSVGRTDVPGGSQEALFDSIKSKLLILSPGVQVYPGHGPETTIGEEKASNPFLASARL